MGKKHNHISESQAHLPFRNKHAGMWALAHPLERRAVVLLSFLVVVSAVLYIYFMMSSVMHVAARGEASADVSQLSSEVARLEAMYLTKTERITESFARERGFVAIAERSFVEQSTTLTLNNTR